MKKIILFIAMVVLAISMVACNGKQENESNASDVSQTSIETENDEAETTVTKDGITENESTSEESVDYSGAKAQIDALNESISGYTKDLIKKDDKSASWLAVGSNNDYENGGGYKKNWTIYVINEETKQYFTVEGLYENTPKTEDKMAYDYTLRIGNGTYKICAIYQNDEKGVYFYAEDEVVLDDTTLRDYKGLNSYVYNVTDLVGADFTAMTFQLDHE